MVTNLFISVISAGSFVVKDCGRGNSQPDINLGEGLPEPVRALAGRLFEMRLGAVQGLKQCHDVALVGLLSRGEAGFVHAVVDLVVLPLVGLVDLLAQILGVELNAAVLFVDEVVELHSRQHQISVSEGRYIPPSQTFSGFHYSHC